MTELTFEERMLLRELQSGPQDDRDCIPERVLVNRGLARRVGTGLIEVTGEGRAAHATLLAEKAGFFHAGTKRKYEAEGDRADMWLFELWHFLGDVIAALKAPRVSSAPSSTCYLDRSEVRQILIGIGDAETLKKVDALPIVTASDLAGVQPTGWKLVPIQADIRMMQTGYVAFMQANKTQVYGEAIADHMYRAMLAASPAPPNDAQAGSYLVWSNEHRAWWRPNNSGYTIHFEQAGRYSRDEAIKNSQTRSREEGEPMPEIAIAEQDVIECRIITHPAGVPARTA